MKETDRQTDECTRKIGLVSIAGVVVRMRQPLPRFWVIVYVCKLLGFLCIFSVYSCILIRVSAFSVAAPWFILNCCMAFRALTEGSLLKLRQEALMHLYNGVCCMLAVLKLRQEEALMHLYNSVCCILAGSTVYIRLQCWSTPVLQPNRVLTFSFATTLTHLSAHCNFIWTMVSTLPSLSLQCLLFAA